MPFTAITDRNDVSTLIRPEYYNEIFQGVTEESAVLRVANRLPNMSAQQNNLPVLNNLPTAYFVNGDTGLKRTTEMAWVNRQIIAEDVAVIVPIPENVLADSSYDIWGQVRPKIVEAFGLVIDQAIMYGTNAPASWPQNWMAAAAGAGNTVALGAVGDLYDDILSLGGVASLLEADGYFATGYIGAMQMRSRMRGLRDADGNLIFKSDVQGGTFYALDGVQVVFPRNGSVDAAQSFLFAGDFQQVVYSIRQDMTFKILTEAVIQDAGGNIVYNLAQQDMVALRCVMRLGWQVPNPVNRLEPAAAARYPVSVLTP